MAKSHYEKGMYNQLMEVMARLDAVENDFHTEKAEHKDDVKQLNAKIDNLTQENQLLCDDNARLKSIINNDSSNTSLPPSSDTTAGKPANTFNSREKTNRKPGGQKGHFIVQFSFNCLLTVTTREFKEHSEFARPFQATDMRPQVCLARGELCPGRAHGSV